MPRLNALGAGSGAEVGARAGLRVRGVVGLGAVVALSGALTTTAGAQVSAADVAPNRYSFESEHMGTTFRIVTYAVSESVAMVAADEAFALIGRLDSLFSDYRTDSEVARLADKAGAAEPMRVSGELFEVLTEAQLWANRTAGAFDTTVGPLSKLWRWSSRRGSLPDRERLGTARDAVDHTRLVLDSETGTAHLTREGMSIDLGGIAKGYAAAAVLEAVTARGFESTLVDAGGDLALGAPPPGSTGWRVSLPDGSTVRLHHVGVATSGDAYRHVVIDGVRYSHVVDPRTGLGIVDAPTVTVVAPDATTADVLASALTVLDPDAGYQLATSLEGIWVSVDGAHAWTAGPGLTNRRQR